MRPIDADALKKAFAKDGHLSGYSEEFIDDTPTLDVTLVIPCKRCKYFKYGDYCTHGKMEHSHCAPDDYCSYVELREESDTEDE